MAFLAEVRERFIRLNILDLSAQLAYYFLISFFPFLLLLVALLGYLPVDSRDVLNQIHTHLPSLSDEEVIKKNLEMIFDRESTGLFSVSLIITLYVASFGFNSLIRALDSIYEVIETRKLWKEWIVGIALVMGLLVGLVVTLILSVFGDAIGNVFLRVVPNDSPIQMIWDISRWLISSVLLVGIFLCMYIFAPNVKVRARDAIGGAIFTTFAWQLSSLLFSYYIQFANYTYLYGNLASAMILIGWFYWSSCVLMIGGLINVVRKHRRCI